MGLNLTNINFSGDDTNLLVQQFFAETLFHTRFGAEVLRGFKSKFVWHELEDNIKLAAYADCPTEGVGEATLNQRTDELCRFMMTAQFNNDVLLGTYYQSEYGRGSGGDKIDQTQIMQLIIDRFINKAVTQWDEVIFYGDTNYTFAPEKDYLELCDGYFVAWEDDEKVNKVDATTVTAANVQAELDKVWNAIPKILKYTNDERRRVRLGVSVNIADAWVQAQTALGAQNPGAGPTEDGILRYRGLDMVPIFTLEDDTMFASPPSNLKLVYDDQGDFASFNVTDKSQSDALCNVTTVRMDAKGRPVYGLGENIVYYRLS